MPRVHHVKAQKDYKDIGVKAGEMYYWWRCYRRPKQRSKTRPRPSQLSSAKSAEVEDAILDARQTIEGADSVDDITAAIEAVAESAREIAGQYEESAEAMAQTASGGSWEEEVREKQSQLEDFADSLEGFSPETSDLDEIDEKIAAKDEKKEGHEDEERDLDQEREDVLSAIKDEATSLLDEFPL